MKYGFVNYNVVPDGVSPAGWSQMIGPYWGILRQLALRHEVHYFIYSGSPTVSTVENVTCHFIDKKRRGFFDAGIHTELKRFQPELIFLYGLYFQRQMLFLSRLFRNHSPLIVQSHSFLPARGWRRMMERICSSWVDGFAFVSRQLAEEWVNGGNFPDTSKVFELMPAASFLYPVNRQQAREKTSIKGAMNFLWVGRLNTNKDPITVLAAFVRFRLVYPSAKLYMIYQDAEMLETVREFLKEKKEHNVFLKGSISNEKLLYWYNSADYFLSGSHHESFGIALCEAMSCGLYPIVTSIPSFKKITANGSFGTLYEAGDVDALLAAMKIAVHKNAAHERQRILDHYSRNMSFEAIAKKLEDVSIEILKSRSTSSATLIKL